MKAFMNTRVRAAAAFLSLRVFKAGTRSFCFPLIVRYPCSMRTVPMCTVASRHHSIVCTLGQWSFGAAVGVSSVPPRLRMQLMYLSVLPAQVGLEGVLKHAQALRILARSMKSSLRKV